MQKAEAVVRSVFEFSSYLTGCLLPAKGQRNGMRCHA